MVTESQEPRRDQNRRGGGLRRLMAPKFEKETRICKGCGDTFEACKQLHRTKCDNCIHKERRLEEESQRANQAIQKEQEFRNMCRQACIPPKWVGVTFANSDSKINHKAFLLAKEYAETFTVNSETLVLYAKGYGTGKTHLAACITNYMLYNLKKRVLFKKALDLMLEIRATYSSDSQSELSILQNLLSFQLLVLDDVGWDPPTPWLEQTYWTVIDKRLEYKLPMVITTNYPLEVEGKGVCLGDRIGYRSLSRLREMSKGRFIHTAEKDLR